MTAEFFPASGQRVSIDQVTPVRFAISSVRMTGAIFSAAAQTAAADHDRGTRQVDRVIRGSRNGVSESKTKDTRIRERNGETWRSDRWLE